MLESRQHLERTKGSKSELQKSVQLFYMVGRNGPELCDKNNFKENDSYNVLDIARVINVSKGFISNAQIVKLAEEFTGSSENTEIVLEDLQEKLSDLLKICVKNFEAWEITRSISKMEDIKELKRLARNVKIMLVKRKSVKHYEQALSAVEKIIEGSESLNEFAKRLGISRSILNESIQQCLENEPERYEIFKEKVFQSRTGDIARIIKAARYILQGFSIDEAARKIKQDLNAQKTEGEPEINVDHNTITRDLDKRFTELLNIYENNKYIQKKLNDCGISSYNELEYLYFKVHEILDKGQLPEAIEQKNMLTISIADLIIGEYNKFDKQIINAQEVFAYLKNKMKISISADLVTKYMKGRLFRLDKDKYKQVMEIWSEDPMISIVNSFENDISVETEGGRFLLSHETNRTVPPVSHSLKGRLWL